MAVARQPYRHRGFSSFPLLGDGVYAIYDVHDIYITRCVAFSHWCVHLSLFLCIISIRYTFTRVYVRHHSALWAHLYVTRKRIDTRAKRNIDACKRTLLEAIHLLPSPPLIPLSSARPPFSLSSSGIWHGRVSWWTASSTSSIKPATTLSRPGES